MSKQNKTNKTESQNTSNQTQNQDSKNCKKKFRRRKLFALRQ